jgi:hypothetical protein
MKIPTFILTLVGTAALAMQAWTMNAVVELKMEVSALKATFSANHNNHNLTQN